MMLNEDKEEDIEELILGYSRGLGKTLAELTSNKPEDIRKQLDKELEATKAFNGNGQCTRHQQLNLDDWAKGEQILFVKEYCKRNIKHFIKGLPAKIIDRPPLQQVSKATQSEKASKLFYNECSFTPGAYHKDLHTSDIKSEDGFTTEMEVVYNIFEDNSHWPSKIYGPNIFYKKCKFTLDQDYRTLQTKDMHKDLGFDSKSKVLWDIYKDQSVTLLIVFNIDNKAV
ncbi:MAG: hypothetical protein FRX48_06918 [Lasallia pustulata]|uniref:Uncharacterized protein n=1 Tax=Lasallia pustulata TaxID=136370 RepID=A0A5M8PKA6_9LECA|nr:MAG: hypothetical protein FRX48_06918 [Lasallia pustulata]